MADKYISADAFLRRIQAEMDKEKALQPMDTAYHLFLDMIYDLIEMSVDEMPTDDVVEFKHAEWLREQVALPLSDGSKECVRCSSCLTHWDNESNYCPNCGADMRKGKTDAEIH